MLLPPKGLGFLLGDVSRLMRRSFTRRLQESGLPLTVAQCKVLIVLAREEGMRQIDLAERLDIQPITLARLIDHLAAEGLVERRPDPDDRRAYRIHLLPAAGAHLDALQPVIEAVHEELLEGLTAEESETLIATLQKVRDGQTGR